MSGFILTGLLAIVLAMVLIVACASTLVIVLACLIRDYMKQVSFPLELRARRGVEDPDAYQAFANADTAAANRNAVHPDKGENEKTQAPSLPPIVPMSDFVRTEGFVPPE